MKGNVKLGVVCLARKTFDHISAGNIYEGILRDLRRLENVEIAAVENLVCEIPGAVAAGKLFADSRVDGIVLVSGTFHLGDLALEIRRLNDGVPLLLWGLPELPYDGGKLRLNSACGVNLDASNLIKAGFGGFTYRVGLSPDTDWLDAVRMIAALKRARVGLLGSHAPGFHNVAADIPAIASNFGAEVAVYDIRALLDTEAAEEQRREFEEEVRLNFQTENVAEEKVKKVAELCAKLKNLMDGERLSALALRCWPEFAPLYGIAPCASMSVLQSRGYVLACEGDVDLALTMICHAAAGARTPFGADLSQPDFETDTALLWHCGCAPCNLADGQSPRTLDTAHAYGRGVTAGFVLKKGKMSVARLDCAGGVYRLFRESAESLGMSKLLAGTYAKVSFGHPAAEVLDRLIYSGTAHHLSAVYGDYTAVFDIFARLKGLETL